MFKYFFRRRNLFVIYTDGSLKKGLGSWAFVIMKNSKLVKEAFGTARNQTCTQMEFQAAIEALKALPLGSVAKVYTDSRILVDTMNLWIADWKLNDWKKSNGRSIPGINQIQSLDELCSQHKVEWEWVRAHTGNELNERCDKLCIIARNSIGIK